MNNVNINVSEWKLGSHKAMNTTNDVYTYLTIHDNEILEERLGNHPWLTKIRRLPDKNRFLSGCSLYRKTPPIRFSFSRKLNTMPHR